MDLKPIQERALALQDDLRAWRRDFHQHPELGFQEVRTASIIGERLGALGYLVETQIGGTGVIGLLEGEAGGTGPCMMLRFDMDALPVQEATGADYASRNDGVMHACGHDGHMAVGLGVAKVMHDLRGEWAGKLKLVFQPGEEGLGGAERMIEAGALHDPVPDRVGAMHLWNSREVGWVGLAAGPVMAGCDRLLIDVRGMGGHAAIPGDTHDPIVAAAEIVTGLQHIISRMISPFEPAVISITSIHGGDAFNVIPSTVRMEGTLRAFTPETRGKQISGVQQVAGQVAGAMGCTAEVRVERVTPPVVNAHEAVRAMSSVVSNLYPDYSISEDCRVMASEDMAFFLEKVPGCFIFIGSANSAGGLDSPHHSPAFDFDEWVLAPSTAILAGYAYDFLSGDMDRD